MRVSLTLLLTSLLAAASCGDGGADGGTAGSGGGGSGGAARVCDTGHCDGPADGDCVQYGDATVGVEPYREVCEGGGSTWGAGVCPDRGPGGCRTLAGTSCVTFWYASIVDAGQAREGCEAGGGTFVPP